MKTVIVQKALIFNKNGQLLLLRRSKTDKRRPLQWDLAGGLVEDGETLERAMQREIKEETGLVVESIKLFYATSDVARWQDEFGQHEENVLRLFYQSVATSDVIGLSYEHDKAQWVDTTEALKLLKYERHVSALQYFLDNQLEH